MPPNEQQPERQRVQARERHVARADHQRHEVVAEARQHRHDEQEDHRGAVHRHEAVVGLGLDQRVVRLRQLEAHHQRLDAAEDEEEEGGEQVEDPDLLVIGRGQPREPAAPARSLRPCMTTSGAGAAVRAVRCVLDVHSRPPTLAARAACAARRAPPGRLDVRALLARPRPRTRRRAPRSRARACRRGRRRRARRTGPVDARPSEILNQVSLVWPGTASALPPSFGIHHEWTTSEARDR